jgi:phenylalanyl-tRNA synthetase beta chain
MRAPLSWLRDFTPVEGTPDQIARVLSFLGLVVEGTELVGAPLEGIVAARVLATRPHPAADRIQLVDVDVGDGEALQICCGAFNLEEQDLVPLATVGTTMPSGLEIGRRKLRGEWSNGMLCSASELGVGPEGPAPAILVLPPGSVAPGEPVAETLGLSPDVVFDLEISPNRGDAFSMAGVARDLAAGMRLPFSLPETAHVVADGVEGANVRVEDAAAALCRRFTGTVIQRADAAVVSPLVSRRLTLAGMRPISPVVDVSNYVMLELGQPNHPYDIERLGGGGLVVRRAHEAEQIVTLDGVRRSLTTDDCVIADAEGAAVGVAGIMGGATAEISPETTTVLLEAANFDPQATSATGKRLGLLSEARTRFERGVDIEIADRAVDRFVELLGPAVRRGETTDVRTLPVEKTRVRLRAQRVNLVLGTALTAEQCVDLLSPLGFEADVTGEPNLEITVPTWRPDCGREIDLIEEVARIYGYDNIARTVPPRSAAASSLSDYQKGRRLVQEILTGAGANEAWTSSFLSLPDIERAGLDPASALELENPLDQSLGLLRTSVIPGLLNAARFNTERQAGALSLFEVGNVFTHASPGHSAGPIEGVAEWEQLGLVAVGNGADASYAARTWELLAAGLRMAGASLEPRPTTADGPRTADGVYGAMPHDTAGYAMSSLHPGRRAAIVAGERELGAVGELAAEVADRYDFQSRVAVLVVDLAPLLGATRRGWEARPVSRYPAVDLDVAFVADDDVTAGELGATVRQAAGALAESVALFDVWRGPSLGEGRRSVAFRARLRAPDRTLTEQDVAAVRERVVSAVRQRHGAVLRGG